jgi:16S rRNA (adenine1518-N6/adenine1519-N6)-dimethyltransferase
MVGNKSNLPRDLLNRYGISPKKSLGQNFLTDPQILSRIASAAKLSPEDNILEIGPGLGSLTKHLAPHVKWVVAVELDERFIPILNDQLAGYENVELVQADILDLDPADYFESNYKVVGNVPYYITGAILRHILSSEPKPTIMVLTVQHEVAERMAARPDQMSILSTIVQMYAQVEVLFTIKAGAFWPRPEVDSAVVSLSLYEIPLVKPADEEAFLRLVKMGFGQKRKQLQKNLRALGYSRKELMALLAQIGIDGRRRAETLSVEEWLVIFQALS